MRKKLWLVIPLALATLALAQNHGMVHGAKGEGAAHSEDQRVGTFRFDVKKLVRPNGTFEIQGGLRFQSTSPGTAERPARHVTIEMGRAREYGSEEKVAEFAGPGVMVVRVRNETIRREGRVIVRVADNRPPNGGDRPDAFRIRFNISNSDEFYEFAGGVRRGDILVYHRRP